MGRGILKLTAGLFIAVLIIGCSALLATVYTSRRITSVIEKSMLPGATSEERPLETRKKDGMTALDFCETTGITEAELVSYFDTLKLQQHLDQVRLILTLSNDFGHCLVDSPIALQWDEGIDWRQIGSSGLAEFALSPKQLKNLKVIVPDQYQILRQRTFSLGNCYEQPPLLDDVSGNHETVNDDLIQQSLFRGLQKVRSAETVFSRLNATKSLRRPETDIQLSTDQPEPMSVENFYRRYRSSVVVIGMLQPEGLISQGTGFVLNSSGVVVTNFHVVNKPTAIAAGLLTSDHRFFEVKEILAGSPSDDLVLIRIDAEDLVAIPLAERDADAGTELLAISHPDSHYFSMTFGRTTRYFQTTRHAAPSLRMGVTADFSEGSSGGPVLNMSGNVVGIISATRGNAGQMIHREVIPVSSLRRLTGNAVDD